MRTEEEIKTALSVMGRVTPISDAVLVLAWVLDEAPEVISEWEKEKTILCQQIEGLQEKINQLNKSHDEAMGVKQRQMDDLARQIRDRQL